MIDLIKHFITLLGQDGLVVVMLATLAAGLFAILLIGAAVTDVARSVNCPCAEESVQK